MGIGKRQQEVWAMRGKMRSPGHPVAGRDVRVRFWKAIARGVSTEVAAVQTGVSPAVGARWFRHSGGMTPISLAPITERYLSFREREEIAILHAQHVGVRAIARRLNRAPSNTKPRNTINNTQTDKPTHKPTSPHKTRCGSIGVLLKIGVLSSVGMILLIVGLVLMLLGTESHLHRYVLSSQPRQHHNQGWSVSRGSHQLRESGRTQYLKDRFLNMEQNRDQEMDKTAKQEQDAETGGGNDPFFDLDGDGKVSVAETLKADAELANTYAKDAQKKGGPKGWLAGIFRKFLKR